MTESLETRLAAAAAEFVAPLRTAAGSPAALQAYLAGLGWDLAGLTGLDAVLPALGDAVAAADKLATAAAAENPDVIAIAAAVAEFGTAIAGSGTAIAQWRPPQIDAARAAELAADVLAWLTDDWLRTRAGRVRTVLAAAGLVSFDPTSELTAGGTVVRRAGCG